jgi:L-amino acid N-acyltransferase YncA
VEEVPVSHCRAGHHDLGREDQPATGNTAGQGGGPAGGSPSWPRAHPVAQIRDATPEDWLAIWAFMRPIVETGETYSWDRDLAEEEARQIWLRWQHQPAGFTVVAVDSNGTILGTAESGPNHGGPAAHVASASFMVAPGHEGRGVGRALGEYVLDRARSEGFRAMQFNAVVETNTRAVALWQSLGFDILVTVPEAFNHPVTGYTGLHIMYRRL